MGWLPNTNHYRTSKICFVLLTFITKITFVGLLSSMTSHVNNQIR